MEQGGNVCETLRRVIYRIDPSNVVFGFKSIY